MDFDRLLVATKFAPPRIGARYIVRKQLLSALQRNRGLKLTLVPGSAGFGKTILLAQWRQELMKEGLQVAWLSLSPDERLLPNFSAHLFAALAKLGLPIGNELPLVGDRGGSMDSVVATVVNHLATVEDDLYLILDDYHHVEDPTAHSLVQKLVELSPGNLHVAIASRALPPLSVARLRVMGQVSEIDCGDLPFDLAETRAFLEQSIGGPRVSADEVAQIHDLTNGWPACLQLVSILLKNRPERRATLHDLAWQSSDLQNYLSEDVVDRLPTDVADFMEAISICRRFSSELAAAVTGSPHAGELLRRIEEENLLISRVESDDRSPWYRFHPLFAEFLSARLQRRGPEAVDELHRRASAWCAEKGLVVEAVRHASQGHDLSSAVAIFDRASPATWRLSHLGPMLHLLNNLPPETISSHPRLLLLASLTTALTGRPARAAVWADQLRVTAVAETPEGAFRMAFLDGLLAFQRDDTARTLELLEPLKPRDAKTSLERYVFLSIVGYSLVAAGRYTEAHQLLADNAAPLEERNEDLAIVTEACRPAWHLLAGNAVEAERLAAAIYARAVAVQGRQSLSANLCAVTLATALLELNRIDEARELLANRQQIISTYPSETMIRAALCRARLDLIQDSPDAALTRLEDDLAMFRSLGLDRGVAFALAEQASIHLAGRNLQRARDVVDRLDEVARRNAGADGFRAEIAGVTSLAKARLLAATGAHEAALEMLDTVREFATRLGRGRMLVTSDVVTALVLEAAGRPNDASEALARAVEHAAPMGLVRTFLAEGPQLHTKLGGLKAEIALGDRALAHLDALLIAFGGSPERTGSGTGKVKALLTPREVEILGLVATGMSNKRIALTLSITLETVKWNLKNVFLKLEVSSRYDAMIWARRQGLIT